MDDQEIVSRALDILARKHRKRRLLSNPKDTRDFLILSLAELKNEIFGCIFLDNRHRVLALEHLFNGTIDGASVHPRVVVQRSLELNSAAVIFFHNHPSGIAEPSQADLHLTRRLKEALGLVDVRVLDHIVVGEGIVSFAERGLL